eukprot:2385436-Pleurochrysis_carterae.AAC.8
MSSVQNEIAPIHLLHISHHRSQPSVTCFSYVAALHVLDFQTTIPTQQPAIIMAAIRSALGRRLPS